MGSVPGGGVIGETSGLPPEGGGQALETGVIRRAFRMAVTPGRETEYIRRHQPIWPELEATLLAYGVRTYSIFLDAATSTLFAYVEFDSVERWEAVARTDVCQQWWAHMRELMPCNPDNSPVTSPLDEVFHIGR
jgi:L-rhamnose mutarotase